MHSSGFSSSIFMYLCHYSLILLTPLSPPSSASLLLSLLPFISLVVHLLLSSHVVCILTVLSGWFLLKIKWRNLVFDKLSPNIPLSSRSGCSFSSKYTLASISGYLCSLLSPWVVNGNKSYNFCVLVKVTPTTIAEASLKTNVLPQVNFTTTLQKALGDCAWWVALFYRVSDLGMNKQKMQREPDGGGAHF